MLMQSDTVILFPFKLVLGLFIVFVYFMLALEGICQQMGDIASSFPVSARRAEKSETLVAMNQKPHALYIGTVLNYFLL